MNNDLIFEAQNIINMLRLMRLSERYLYPVSLDYHINTLSYDIKEFWNNAWEDKKILEFRLRITVSDVKYYINNYLTKELRIKYFDKLEI